MNRTFKRRKDAFAELSDHIRQHIQTPTMGHAQRDVFNAPIRRTFNQPIQQGNNGFTAFKRESFLTQILGMKKPLKLFG